MRAVKTGEVELLKRLIKSLAPSQFKVKDRLGNTVHHAKGSDTYMTLEIGVVDQLAHQLEKTATRRCTTFA